MSDPITKGIAVSMAFFALGVLVLFFSSVLLGLVDFIRRVVG